MPTGEIWAGQEWAAFEMRLEAAERACEHADAVLGAVTLGLTLVGYEHDKDDLLRPVLKGAAAMLDESIKKWRYELEHPRRIHPVPGYSLVRCNKDSEPHVFHESDCEDAILIRYKDTPLYDQGATNE